jgi:hypothetical protein
MVDLTPTMKACLTAVAAEQGRNAAELPGGISTVWALMRRRLVETDMREAEHWRVFLPAHRHQFTSTLHLDGCHHFTNSGRCQCGVVIGARGERAFKAHPESMVWYSDNCDRCRALRDGARPIHEVVIQRPRNYAAPLRAVA